MSNKSTTNIHLFTLLKGIWQGEGRGQFPTVTSFDHRETLIFTRYDEKTLAYEQRTQKRYDGSTEWLAYLPNTTPKVAPPRIAAVMMSPAATLSIA